MNFEKIQKELDYYQKFTPVNFAEERTKFFERVKKNQPSVIKLITNKRPKWISVKDFDKENLEYFKNKMNRIVN